ncbi:MAG: CotH kinase family protein [Deltaproteobacteria bacterium]|nr:CotH kinase family protein [Deltaproteobacteria bacterium]
MILLMLGCGESLDTAAPGDSAATSADLLPPVVEGDADGFYADGTIQRVDIELSAEAIAALEADPRTWVEGVFAYEGQRYGPVGVRIKGESSYRSIDEKPSLKVKFSEYQADGRFMGMRRLVFNNMVSDPSMLRERVAYRFFRQRGVPAPRCNHAVLSVNGEPYGLYSNVENTDEELLGGWFDDAEGSMWEIHDADFQEGLLDGFEIEEGEDDRSQIEALTAVMATIEGPARMFDYVDEPAWWLYFATMAYVGNLDGYPFSEPGDDAHLYLDPGTGLFNFIPHGLDETFLDDASVEYVMHGILATACIEDSACKATWREHLAVAIADADAAAMQAWVDEIAAEIDAEGDADPRKEYTDAEVDEARDYVKMFMDLRSADLEEQMTWD